MKRNWIISLIWVFVGLISAGSANACADKSITLDIRTIDYKAAPYDPLLSPLLGQVDRKVTRIEVTFASPKPHPDITDLQAAALKYVQSKISLYGYDPMMIVRQEVMLPRSFAGRDELYRLVISYGPKDLVPVAGPSPVC